MNRPVPAGDAPRRGLAATSRTRLLTALLMLACIGQASAQVPDWPMQTLPEQPRTLQATWLHVMMPDCQIFAGVRHIQGTLEVEVRPTAGCFIPRPGFRNPRTLALGKLPQGEYRVRLVDAGRPDRPLLAPELAFTVEPPPPGVLPDEFEPLHDYSGWWMHGEQDRGEGWLVEHVVPDRLMFTWVGYDADGEPTWLVMQSTSHRNGRLSGPVYRSHREGDQVIRTLIGQGTFLSLRHDEAWFILRPVDPSAPQVETPLRRLPL
ncbi:MAG: hypothetical protein KF823_05470 [Xanthomonadales bacterium]|nr:hypothetical protein [Xanthomonadales bacterium]